MIAFRIIFYKILNRKKRSTQEVLFPKTKCEPSNDEKQQGLPVQSEDEIGQITVVYITFYIYNT